MSGFDFWQAQGDNFRSVRHRGIESQLRLPLPLSNWRVGPKELLQLLKRLLHAEAKNAGIALLGVSVSLQITVPDEGHPADFDELQLFKRFRRRALSCEVVPVQVLPTLTAGADW
jgi:hypothetical protein